MKTLLIVLLIITGVILAGSVMLMSPKGGLGFGMGGLAGAGNEFRSKKSLEHTLKRVALVSVIVFVLISLYLPHA